MNESGVWSTKSCTLTVVSHCWRTPRTQFSSIPLKVQRNKFQHIYPHKLLPKQPDPFLSHVCMAPIAMAPEQCPQPTIACSLNPRTRYRQTCGTERRNCWKQPGEDSAQEPRSFFSVNVCMQSVKESHLGWIQRWGGLLKVRLCNAEPQIRPSAGYLPHTPAGLYVAELWGDPAKTVKTKKQGRQTKRQTRQV